MPWREAPWLTAAARLQQARGRMCTAAVSLPGGLDELCVRVVRGRMFHTSHAWQGFSATFALP